MFFLKTYTIRSFEVGLHFHRGEFRDLLGAGTHRFFDPLGRVEVHVVARRVPVLVRAQLALSAKWGEVKGHAQVLELEDDQRALVWIDRRFARIFGPGQYVYWTDPRTVRVEVIDARRPRFEHDELKVIARHASA